MALEIRDATIMTDGGPVTLTRDENGMLYLNIPGEPYSVILEMDSDEVRAALDYVTREVAP